MSMLLTLAVIFNIISIGGIFYVQTHPGTNPLVVLIPMIVDMVLYHIVIKKRQ